MKLNKTKKDYRPFFVNFHSSSNKAKNESLVTVNNCGYDNKMLTLKHEELSTETYTVNKCKNKIKYMLKSL